MSGPYQRILVPVDPSAYAEAAALTACQVAKKHEAQVAGIAVLDSTEIRSSLVPAVGPYYPLMIDAVNEKMQHADKLLHECLEKFGTICDAEGVSHFETEYEGLPVQKFLQSAIFYDLVVAGLETSFHFETREGETESLEKLLDHTSTPVLAVPLAGMPNPKKVLVAFDGTIGASRALRDFVEFARPYDLQVTVVSAGMKPEYLEFLARNASEFLESHGFRGVASVTSEKAIEEVINEDLGSEFDLVVAGTHSRKPVKDFFLGSFAKNLIRRGNTPLFLSH